MPGKQTRKSSGDRKHLRNKEKCKQYALANTRYRNKLKRIRQSNGEKAALAYQRTRGQTVRYTKRTGAAVAAGDW